MTCKDDQDGNRADTVERGYLTFVKASEWCREMTKEPMKQKQHEQTFQYIQNADKNFFGEGKTLRVTWLATAIKSGRTGKRPAFLISRKFAKKLRVKNPTKCQIAYENIGLIDTAFCFPQTLSAGFMHQKVEIAPI